MTTSWSTWRFMSRRFKAWLVKCEKINASISYVLYFNKYKYKSMVESPTVTSFCCLSDVIRLDARVQGSKSCMQLCNALTLGKGNESLLRLRIKRLEINCAKAAESAARLDLLDHKVHDRDHCRMRSMILKFPHQVPHQNILSSISWVSFCRTLWLLVYGPHIRYV